MWIDIPKDVQTAVFEIEAQPAVAEKAAAPAFSEESIRDAATMITPPNARCFIWAAV